MLGLIKQLAKLITVAINIPQLLLLLPKMITENEETKTLDITNELATALSVPEIIASAEMFVTGSEAQRVSAADYRNMAYGRIDADPKLTDDERTMQRNIVTDKYTKRLQEISEDVASNIQKITENIPKEKAKQMDPSIRTALAPLTMMVGIPAGIIWLTDTLSSLGNVSVVGADAAEAAFNSAINAEEASSGADGEYPVGSTIEDEGVLLTFSRTAAPSFEYDNNGIGVPKLNFFIKDDVKDNPNYTLTLTSYGVNFPSNQKDSITYFIDKNTGRITVDWRYASVDPNIIQPNFDNSITFTVQGDKINRRFWIFPDGTKRAVNTFAIPIKFATTFPQQQ